MSIHKEALASRDGGENKKKWAATKAKPEQLNRCFSSLRLNTIPVEGLKDIDSDKLKAEIKRWAKAVVAYASQATLEEYARQAQRHAFENYGAYKELNRTTRSTLPRCHRSN